MSTNDTNWISKRDKENLQPDSISSSEILQVRKVKNPQQSNFSGLLADVRSLAFQSCHTIQLLAKKPHLNFVLEHFVLCSLSFILPKKQIKNLCKLLRVHDYLLPVFFTIQWASCSIKLLIHRLLHRLLLISHLQAMSAAKYNSTLSERKYGNNF